VSEAPPTEPVPAAPPVVPRDGGRAGSLASGLGLALLCALIAVTWAGGEVSAPPAGLTLLVLFLPYLYALLAAVVFALWTVVPDRRLPPLVLAAVLVAAAWRWGPAWSGDPDAAEGAPLVVMTWNVQRLWSPETEAPADCVADGIREVGPDVLALLEVSADDVTWLAERLEMRCRQAPYTGSGQRVGGLAVCVRGDRWRLRHGEGQRFVDQEDWSYLFAEVEGDGAVFNVLAVHLYPYRVGVRDLQKSARRLIEEGETEDLLRIGDRGARIGRAQSDQSAALLARVAKLRDPTVIAGDFNSTRDTALHVALRRTLVDAWERAGSGFGGTIRVFGRIPLRVDHVYTSSQFHVLGAEVPTRRCSDHQPVVARLTLPPG